LVLFFYVLLGGGLLLTCFFEDEYDFENFKEIMEIDEESFVESMLGTDVCYKEIYPTFFCDIGTSVYKSKLGGFIYDSKYLPYIEIPAEFIEIKEIVYPTLPPHKTCKGVSLCSSVNEDYLFSFRSDLSSSAKKILRRWMFFSSTAYCYRLAEQLGWGWNDLSEESREIISIKVEDELKKYETVGIVNRVSKGLTAGLCGDFLYDEYIKEESHLKFALNLLDWLSKPSKYRLIKLERKLKPLSFVHP
jgi:hypothetical protein